jgi:hypothetical protein
VVDDGKSCCRIKDTDHVRLMTPLQFLARMAALVPPSCVMPFADDRRRRVAPWRGAIGFSSASAKKSHERSRRA